MGLFGGVREIPGGSSWRVALFEANSLSIVHPKKKYVKFL